MLETGADATVTDTTGREASTSQPRSRQEPTHADKLSTRKKAKLRQFFRDFVGSTAADRHPLQAGIRSCGSRAAPSCDHGHQNNRQSGACSWRSAGEPATSPRNELGRGFVFANCYANQIVSFESIWQPSRVIVATEKVPRTCRTISIADRTARLWVASRSSGTRAKSA